jgi:glycosidase
MNTNIIQSINNSKTETTKKFLLNCFVAITCIYLGLACKSTTPTPASTTPSVTEVVTPQYDTPFANVPQTSDVVMYEVNLGAFSSSGNIQGVIAQLDSIKNLGVNVVWLMPIYPTGQLKGVGSPYAVKNYTEVNPTFGTLEDLRTLVKEAHKRNMALILDWVGNHTAWDNPWIQNPTWYVRDAAGNIIIPPNTTWNDVAELNYSSSAMRKEMIKSMKYWVLQANIDGFRCDYASGIPTDFWKQAIDTLRSMPNRKVIMFAESDKKDLFSAGFDMIFGWNFYGKLKDVYNKNNSVNDVVLANSADYVDVPSGSHILRWTSNHDDDAWEDTPIVFFKGNEGATTAFAVTSYMGGVPLLYNGQEVGCPIKLGFFTNSTTKINWSINPQIRNEYKKLMAFRNTSNAVKRGTITPFHTADVLAFKRSYNSEEVLVIANLRSTQQTYPIPTGLTNTTWKNAFSGQTVSLSNSLVLTPYSYLILKN